MKMTELLPLNVYPFTCHCSQIFKIFHYIPISQRMADSLTDDENRAEDSNEGSLECNSSKNRCKSIIPCKC